MSHLARPAHDHRHPVHVTLHISHAVPHLRRQRCLGAVQAAFRAARNRSDMRVAHYTILDDHVHMVVEADDKRSLSRGMQGLSVRIARSLNRRLGRSGKVFSDRFHARALGTPREVHRVLRYVLTNGRVHLAREGIVGRPWRFDPCSSGACFDGWAPSLGRAPPPLADEVRSTIQQPRTWLLQHGWRLHGSIVPRA